MLEKKELFFTNSLIRLMACQALCMYNNEYILQDNIDNILYNINEFFINEFFNSEKTKYENLYKNKSLINLVHKILKNQKIIDQIIIKHLQSYNTIENLLDTTRECFRLAVYELLKFKDLKYEIIVSEYVDIIAELTNDAKETKFANNILERIALDLRHLNKTESGTKFKKRTLLSLTNKAAN